MARLRIDGRLLAIAALLALAWWAEPTMAASFVPLPAGQDFCFAFADAGTSPPSGGRLVRSLAFTGRNAWRAEPTVPHEYRATLVASFWDTDRTLVMDGRCWGNEFDPQAEMRCSFVLSEHQDVLQQELEITWPSEYTMRVSVGADWRVVREGKPPTGRYDTVTPGDDAFVLDKQAPESCTLPK
jgi:hypothetical protein